MEEFDQEIFNALVDYIIIGGYDENEVNNIFLMRKMKMENLIRCLEIG